MNAQNMQVGMCWRQRCQATPPLSSDIALSGACPPQRHVDITCPISSRVPMWLAVTFSVRLNKMSAVWAQLFDGVISARGIFGRYTNNIVEYYDMCNSTQNNVSSSLFPKFCQTRIRIHRTL